MLSFPRILWINLILLRAVFGSNPDVVLAISGRSTGLPCNLTSPTPGDEIALVLWYKDESTTPIYSLDSRRSPSKVAKHVAAEEYASRAYLDTVQDPSSLQLSPVLKDDEGEYKCRADFKNARTRYSSVILRVIVPPNTPVISDETGEILQSLIGPYNEGDRLRLVCETEGDPLPALTWWRESVLLDQTFQHYPKGVTRNDLDIPILTRQDLMAVLSCRATNNNITAPETSMVTVDLNFRPLELKLDYSGHPLSAMKPVELTCRSSGSRPPATISWWKGKTKLKKVKDRISVDGNTTVSTLHYVPTNDDNGELLSCRAENLLITGSQILEEAILNVHYIPKVSLRLGNKLRHKHIQEGNDVYFECGVLANPWIGQLEWLFDGLELVTNTSAGVILSNHSLVLQNVRREKRGRYVCKGKNSEGEGISNTVTLRVQYAPVCKMDQLFRYGAAPRETIEVSCEVEADPSTVTFFWLYNRTSHAPNTITFTSEGSKSVATYKVVSDDYYGTLYCWASNNVATQTTPCQFVIFQAGPPDPVFNCSVTNQTMTSFIVECQHSSGSSSMLPYYLMEVYDNQFSRLRLNVTSFSPSFQARKLPSASIFIVVIFAVNAKGKSESVVFQTATLASHESLQQPNTEWKATFSPLLVVLVSIVVALVATAFLFVVIIRVKQNYNEERVKQSGSKDKNSMELYLQKDQPSYCKSANSGLDEKCPDIISDFTSQDAYLKNNISYTQELYGGVTAIRIPQEPFQETTKAYVNSQDIFTSLQEPA